MVEPNFEWIRDIEVFNEVLDKVEENVGLEAITDSKVLNFKNVLKFIDNILSGKINNKYDAEKEYVEKIINDEKLLRSYKNNHNYKWSWICYIWTFLTIRKKNR